MKKLFDWPYNNYYNNNNVYLLKPYQVTLV